MISVLNDTLFYKPGDVVGPVEASATSMPGAAGFLLSFREDQEVGSTPQPVNISIVCINSYNIWAF